MVNEAIPPKKPWFSMSNVLAPCLAAPRAATPVDMHGVVLEMKFTDRFPNWMRQMVHALDLWRVPSAKYVAGVRAVGHPWIRGIGKELGVAS